MRCDDNNKTDRHHLVPRYKGGTNDPVNIVKVSRVCHAMFHYCNWSLWGNKEDYIAYKGLSSQINSVEIHREVSSLAGKKSYLNKTGIFSISPEEKKEYSSRGGKKAGRYMSQSMWINNGEINKRVPKQSSVPEGWMPGRLAKNKGNKKKRTWAEYLDSFSHVYKKRIQYLQSVDLTEWGIKTKIANEWGVSRSQVNRFIAKYYSPDS